jgi:tyrosyl-tRNA synthetase
MSVTPAWSARMGGMGHLAMNEAAVEEVAVEDAPTEITAPLKSEFLQEMQWRGFIHQATNIEALDEALASRSVTAYLGFDATASSLHVGSLLQIMLLRHFQRCGHKPVVLVGGGTTKVGDPSGKDASRVMMTQEKIDENIRGISQVFEKFIKFGDGPADALMVNNDDWLSGIEYLSFLRDYGKYFTINRMLSFESVKQRLARESPLSFLEFNYMILQAYDFLELHRRHKAELQFGGSDQWGNIINGVELVRRRPPAPAPPPSPAPAPPPLHPHPLPLPCTATANPHRHRHRAPPPPRPSPRPRPEPRQARKADGAALFGCTAPLLTTSDGKKMGKTADGAVWLNADLLTPFAYWQFWRNTDDADVGRFLRIFTELPRAEIEALEALQGAEINKAKQVLADEATRMLHGDAVLDDIQATAKSLFASGGGGGGSTDALPRVQLSAAEAGEGVTLIDLFIRLEFAKSKSEVRRLVKGGGARLNGEKVEDAELVVSAATFEGDAKELKLSSGKKKHGLVVLA